MIKQSIYPKTQRLQLATTVTITEKVDGSNLVFFVYNGELFIAQRNNVFSYNEVLSGSIDKNILYKGLRGFLDIHHEELEKSIFEGSALCGEWLGMGQIKYGDVFGDFKFLMFAKARVVFKGGLAYSLNEVELERLSYDHENFMYAFNDQTIPSFIGSVPVVEVSNSYNALTIEHLDELYSHYTEQVGRSVEGFVVYANGGILKYVRMKNGTLSGHFDRGE